MRTIVNETVRKIKSLRQKGFSVPEISREVSVSRTSVLRYCQGVQILPDFVANWACKRGGSRKIKLLKEEEAFKEGNYFVGQLTNKEKLLFLSALYWAEGNKKDFSLTNTDPELIKVFVGWIKEILKIVPDRIRLNIRIYEDLNQSETLKYWLQVTGLSEENFGGFNILEGKKKGKLQYGMCRIRVLKGGDLLKKIMGINKAVAYACPHSSMDRASRS